MLWLIAWPVGHSIPHKSASFSLKAALVRCDVSYNWSLTISCIFSSHVALTWVWFATWSSNCLKLPYHEVASWRLNGFQQDRDGHDRWWYRRTSGRPPPIMSIPVQNLHKVQIMYSSGITYLSSTVTKSRKLGTFMTAAGNVYLPNHLQKLGYHSCNGTTSSSSTVAHISSIAFIASCTCILPLGSLSFKWWQLQNLRLEGFRVDGLAIVTF